MNIDELPEDVRVELFNRAVSSGTTMADLREDVQAAFVHEVMSGMNYQLFDIIAVLKKAGFPYFLKFEADGKRDGP
jgi:hypothetical protein